MKLAITMLFGCAVLAQQEPRPGLAPAVCAAEEMTEFGLDCPADEPCPVLLELAAVEAAGARLFLTGNLHTAAATLWSVLLMSEDGGKSWVEPFPRIRGAVLDQIQFIGSDAGWAAGHIAGSLPKDPFLLKTTDGGKSWRRIPVFEESTYASVEQLRFTSPAEGTLTLSRRGAASGRTQRLETMSGGDTWMTSEVSAQAAPPAKPRPSDWRIRADGPSKSLRIEHREGGVWAAAASFPLRAGECKPDPPKAIEP